MDPKLEKTFAEMRKRGLTPAQETRFRAEIEAGGDHGVSEGQEAAGIAPELRLAPIRPLYAWADPAVLQAADPPRGSYTSRIRSIDELLEKDKQREKDGFPRKIRVGRMIKPIRGGKDKVVVVPTTVEEKFIHDPNFQPREDEGAAGSGEGQEGEVIGEQPIRPDQGDGSGPGEGSAGQHEMESSAYDLGRILTEQFELPNLQDKGKKRSLSRYTYDLTDRNRGFGQVLDKKATLRRILETNIGLGRVGDVGAIDPTGLVITPHDKIYRILSKEMDYESQAMVFFLRDYSGSMTGKPTELVCAQHVLIYSWLLYQYDRQVETRFILHDTEAKEVPDFYTYYNSKVAGGTKVASAFRMVNEIVETQGLARDYNIYVFHGTDGDDWDTEGKETVPEITRMLTYANRVGITIAERRADARGGSEVQRYLKHSRLLDEQPKLIRLDVIGQETDEARLIQGIRNLIS